MNNILYVGVLFFCMFQAGVVGYLLGMQVELGRSIKMLKSLRSKLNEIGEGVK